MEDGEIEPTDIPVDPGDLPLATDLVESIALAAVAEALPSSENHHLDRSEYHAVSSGHGRPCFVTAAVDDGLPIDRYCDDRRLDIPARLRIFVRACEAVHFAHQHALIHRDLQPDNIRVTAEEVVTIVGMGTPRKIDLETGGERILTPAFTSPEQINRDAVTTASDLYAMGVVLYELLAGRWPYHLKSPHEAADILQAICEQAPERPSVVIFRHGAEPAGDLVPTAEQIAEARQCSTKRLRQTLRGDLDAIVLKALCKEPEGRYPSIDQFADDLKRSQSLLPVRAVRPSHFDRAWKFVRRNRVLTTAMILTFLALVGAAGILNRRTVKADHDRDQAEQALRLTHHSIDQVFDRIYDNRLLSQRGTRPLRLALLKDLRPFYERAATKVVDSPANWSTIADCYARLAKIDAVSALSDQAIGHGEQAVALWKAHCRDHSDPDSMAHLANALIDLGSNLSRTNERLDEAITTLEHAQTIEEALAADNPQSNAAYHELNVISLQIAAIQRQKGQPDEAVTTLSSVVTIASLQIAENPQSLEARIALADAYSAMGQLLLEQPGELVDALVNYQQGIEIRQRVTSEFPALTDQADQLAGDLISVSRLERRTGQSDLALKSLRQSLEILERLDRLYPGLAIYRARIGTTNLLLSDIVREQGDTADALSLAQKARALLEQLAAEYPENPRYPLDLARSHGMIGRILKRGGETREALRAFQRSIDQFESQTALDPGDRFELACNLALCISLIDRESPSKMDQLRLQAYRDRAISALRQAVRAGSFDLETLQSNSDLNAIRDRPEFQTILQQLEHKPAMAEKSD